MKSLLQSLFSILPILFALASPAGAQNEGQCTDPCDQGQCSEFGSSTDWCTYSHAFVEPLDCPTGWTTNPACLQAAESAYLACVATAIANACIQRQAIIDSWCAAQEVACVVFESCWDHCILVPQPAQCQQACQAQLDGMLATNCTQAGQELDALETDTQKALDKCDRDFRRNSLACCFPPEKNLPVPFSYGSRFVAAK